MREFIARNELTWRRPPDDEAAEMVERLAGREIDEADVAAWLVSYVS